MNYKVGDKVKIKEWANMKREFGMNGSSIDVPFSFTSEMSRLCGQTFTISKMRDDMRNKEYHLSRPENPKIILSYNFSKEMFIGLNQLRDIEKLKIMFQINNKFKDELL